MALVPQDKKRKIELVNAFVKGNSQKANLYLHQEADPQDIYDDTVKAGRQAEVLTLLSNSIKMFRWLADDQSLTVPPAYTDGEVDAINPEIRQKEDGL